MIIVESEQHGEHIWLIGGDGLGTLVFSGCLMSAYRSSSAWVYLKDMESLDSVVDGDCVSTWVNAET